MQILHVISSARGAESYSTRLSQGIVDKLLAAQPGSTVVVRDVVKHPFPPLDNAYLQAYFLPADDLSPAQQQAMQRSDEAIAELLAADILVIGLSIYNATITSPLKAWLDHLTRVGLTLRNTPVGPEGTLRNKKVYLAVASGGIFSEGPMQPYDFATPYLRWLFNFLGLTDITLARAEGTEIPDFKATALQRGLASVSV